MILRFHFGEETVAYDTFTEEFTGGTYLLRTKVRSARPSGALPREVRYKAWEEMSGCDKLDYPTIPEPEPPQEPEIN